MQFNLDLNKQANEVIFSKKKQLYPHHKHLSVVLDSKLDLKFHVDKKILKM